MSWLNNSIKLLYGKNVLGLLRWFLMSLQQGSNLLKLMLDAFGS
jgi:hypothetical protein